MLRLFDLLNTELAAENVQGELYLVGGAVMCLALDARHATRDVDGYFLPTGAVRQAASRVAARAGVPDNWLNDAVKGYLSPRGDFDPYLELDHLKVFAARPVYLLAMKCAPMRLGEEFHDLDDVRYLLRYPDIASQGDGSGDSCPWDFWYSSKPWQVSNNRRKGEALVPPHSMAIGPRSAGARRCAIS
ncbi:MAG: hypothetical protein ABJC13_21490 [Acidobacteriota bacterium]